MKYGHYTNPTTPENVDDRVDDWHESRSTEGMELHEHLGFSKTQYAHWVETGKFPCLHLEGYWIQKDVSFRCYHCNYQFHLEDLTAIPRNIEPWVRP